MHEFDNEFDHWLGFIPLQIYKKKTTIVTFFLY